MEQDVIDRLRVLAAEPADTSAYSDEQLTALLEAAPCLDHTTGRVKEPPTFDVYGVAADVWEDKALAATLAATDADRKVTAERNRDQSISYADRGGKLDAQGMYALATRLRRRSCNGGRSKTVKLGAPGPHGAEPTDGEWPEVVFDAPHPADPDAAYVVNRAEPDG